MKDIKKMVNFCLVFLNVRIFKKGLLKSDDYPELLTSHLLSKQNIQRHKQLAHDEVINI